MSPARGQYLFVRPVADGDAAPLRGLYEADGATPPTPLIAPLALLGKLAGNVVGHVVAIPRSGSIEITHLYVARDLRGKRIGRGLVRRLEELAGRLQYSRLIAGQSLDCAAFLERAGFMTAGDFFEKAVEPAG